MNPSPTEISALTAVLRDFFRLTPAESTESLIRGVSRPDAAADPRRFLVRTTDVPVTLRVAQRLDLAADAIIIDPQLGTLGIVHFLRAHEISPTPSPASERASLPREISRRIGDAAYLRHLLLEDLRPGEPQHGRATPYSVEVVFILSDPSARPHLGNELRHIMREVALLHAIGVSLLEGIPTLAEAPRSSALARGFSWLLHHTRQWLKDQVGVPNPSPTPPPPPTPTKSPALPNPSTALPRPTGFRATRHGLPAAFQIPQKPGPPREIRLKHFRLGGKRRWLLAHDRMLHVVHGPNGSGKSSLVEALELVTTGTLDRLATEDHRAVITNRAIQSARGSSAASVMLRFNPPAERDATTTPPPTDGRARQFSLTWRLTPTGINAGLTPKDSLKPGAFRLNQEIIDLLAQGDAKSRAHLLITFFPDSYSFLTRSRQLTRERDEYLSKLPARLRAQFLNATGVYEESRVESALGWIRDDAVPWDRLPASLPLDSSQLNALLPLLPLTFESGIRRTGTSSSWEPVSAAARQIDDDLRGLLNRISFLQGNLAGALPFLRAYQNAAASASPGSGASLPQRLSEWLELVAATDLHEREHGMLCAFEQLHPDPKVPAASRFLKHLPTLLARIRESTPIPVAQQRSEALKTLASRRDAARRAIDATAKPASEPVTPSSELPELSSFDLGTLDALAAEGVFGRDFIGSNPPLSHAIREAFRTGRPVTIHQQSQTLLAIGEPGAVRDLLGRAERAAAALQALDDARNEFTAPDGGLNGQFQTLRGLHRCLTDQRALKNAAAAELTERLETPLGAALNEFTAMLTPARWAYDDIVSTVDASSAEPSFGLVQRSAGDTTVPASLRLNTAQMSAFALAFFLLCHRARQHPLRLGVLDDPFENMDELTVTAVARGLGRYIRLRSALKDNADAWQLILFLHGEQNVDRVRHEVPCAAYLLPWLSPDAQLGKDERIEPERTEFAGEALQDLSSLLATSLLPSRPRQ